MNTLVEIGLLRKAGTKRAVYSKPVPDEEVEVSEPVTVDEMKEEDEPVIELSDDELKPFVESNIVMFREQRVLLDRDVARVYGVETRRLNEQRERNPDKFPEDFAFQLSDDELTSQNVTAISSMTRYNPWVYTLEGINMAANVLNTPKAVQRSIIMVRVFSEFERAAHGEPPKDEQLWSVIRAVASGVGKRYTQYIRR